MNFSIAAALICLVVSSDGFTPQSLTRYVMCKEDKMSKILFGGDPRRRMIGCWTGNPGVYFWVVVAKHNYNRNEMDLVEKLLCACNR